MTFYNIECYKNKFIVVRRWLFACGTFELKPEICIQHNILFLNHCIEHFKMECICIGRLLCNIIDKTHTIITRYDSNGLHDDAESVVFLRRTG